jgi:hypothetical protein
LEKASTIPPKTEGGLNIEALAATPEGKLLIGFRNPVGVKGALVVPLENPGEVIEGKAARFGDAIPVDLSGRGIRSMERVGDSYLIVGGPVASGGTFMLYRWSGRKDDKPSEIEGIDFKGMSPEALFAVPQTNKIQILSDDGSEPVGSKECNDLDASKQSFRSLIITP